MESDGVRAESARQPSVMEKHHAFFSREAVLGNGCQVIGLRSDRDFAVALVSANSLKCKHPLPSGEHAIGWRSEPFGRKSVWQWKFQGLVHDRLR